MPTKEHHVIILGCGRSGTSIFGEYFEHLTSYSHLSEPPFAELLDQDYSKPVAIKVPTESTDFPPTEGLSFPLEKMLATMPNPKTIFWQIRHPLDTICSLKVGIDKNWGHHPKPHDWRQWLDRTLVEQCAHHWNYLNTVGFEKVSHIVKIMKFEDMIADPRKFATTINEILRIDYKPNSTQIQEWIARVQNSNNSNFREAKTSQPYSTMDHSVRVDRWKENMTEMEIQSVLPLIADTAKKFGYELPHSV